MALHTRLVRKTLGFQCESLQGFELLIKICVCVINMHVDGGKRGAQPDPGSWHTALLHQCMVVRWLWRSGSFPSCD